MGQSKILQWSTILSTPSDRHNENVSEHTFSEPTLFAHKNCKIQIRQKPIPCQGPDVRQARLEHQTSEMIRTRQVKVTLTTSQAHGQLGSIN